MALTPEEEARLAQLEQQFGGVSTPQEDTVSFSDDDNSGSSLASSILGGSAGYLKGLHRAVSAPADLIYKGVNAGLNYVTGNEIDPQQLQQGYPSHLLDTAVDWAAGPGGNKTAEAIGKGVGTVAGAIAGVPSSLPAVTAATEGLSLLPRAAALGVAGGAEGAIQNMALSASDPNVNLTNEAIAGGGLGAAGAMAAPLIGSLAADAKPYLQQASDRLFERSLGGTAKDFVKSAKLSGAEEDIATGAMETKLSNSFKGVREEGIVPTFSGQTGKASAVVETRRLIGDEIGSIVAQLDSAGRSELGGLPGIQPQVQWKNLDAYVNGSPFATKSNALKESETIKDALLNNWNGTAVDLHRGKSALGKLGYSQAPGVAPSAISAGAQRAAEADIRAALQEAIQSGVNSGRLPQETLDRFIDLNRRYGNLRDVENVVKPAAISTQHQRIPSWQKMAWTTGGFGLPMAAAYGAGGIPAAIAAGTLGTFMRTSAGQAVASEIARGGANALGLLTQVADNPYMVQGLSLALLPRNWIDVKTNDTAKREISLRAGIDPQQFNSLPEPVQQEIHKQVIANDPNSAEPSVNNLNLVNNEYLNPMERDAVVRNSLDASPSERYKIIGSSFQNKHPGDIYQLPEARPNSRTNIDLSKINGMFGDLETQYPTISSDSLSMVDRLNQAINKHANDF